MLNMQYIKICFKQNLQIFHLVYRRMEGSVLLKDVKVRTGLIWLRIGSSCRLLWTW